MKRKIGICTGTRAEYGLMKRFIEEVEKSKKLSPVIFVTGMHLLKEHGMTVKEVEKDFPKTRITRVGMPLKGDSRAATTDYLATGIKNFTKAFTKEKPEIVFVLGDRTEALAAAISASYLGIAVAHSQGGDVTGSMIDESIRHSITKFSHIHFPGTKKSEQRLRAMGEQKENIHLVGTFGLSELKEKSISKNRLFRKYSLDPKNKTVLLIQHPVSAESEKAGKQIMQTIKAVKELDVQTIIVYPNCDSGSKESIEIIKKCRGTDFIQIRKSIPRSDFIAFLKSVDLLLGNSSCSFLEAPSLGLPAVVIGCRQEGREKAANVIEVTQTKPKIKEAVKKALYNKSFVRKAQKSKNPYEMKNSEKRAVKVLEKIKTGDKLIRKKFCD